MTTHFRAGFLLATALGFTVAVPAAAQAANEGTESSSSNDIIVTAQRMEQRLQDVPISITVLDQSKLANNNIQNLKDIASLTPGFAVNSRYGADNATFTIRGFYQERQSFSTVGVFFNDVVALRGSGATPGGDGAGPGALFDLQNVQILKGPQGTLFGRNVTGGAVLLVPKKPTDKLEGYVEGSVGNYDMWRLQGVLNVPLSDSLRVRVGVDHMDRHGYLKNIGNLGDGSFGKRGLGDVNYWAVRAGISADLTPDVENYTLFNYTHSQSNGVIPKITAAFPGTSSLAYFGNESAAQMAREAPYGFWTVSNRQPDSHSITDSWQVMNTLTWAASDSLTIKNILSYGEFRGKTNLDLFGNYALLPGVVSGTEAASQVRGFGIIHDESTVTKGHVNAERSMVGELQFQGHPGDGTFTWQAGGYVELNDPLGFSGYQTASFTACADVNTFACLPAGSVAGGNALSGGTGGYALTKTKFRDYALYAQASYKLSSQLTFTAGIRYTWDKMESSIINETSVFQAVPSNVRFGCTNLTAPGSAGPVSPANPATYPFTYGQRLNACQQTLRKDTSAPTWLIDLDYKPIDNVLIYGKWSRGYRQGGLAMVGPDPIQPFDKETVDTFELGAKTSWRGMMPGSFNLAGYYNNFRNQQLQLGVACVPSLPGFTVICSGNTAIINAGKSRIWGIEAEATVSPFAGLELQLAYGYLNAKLLKINAPSVLTPFNSFTVPLVQPCGGEQCDVIVNSGPPHQVTASANYTLPLPASVGKITIGGTFAYQSRRRVVTDGFVDRTNPLLPITSGRGIAPSSSVLNLNATWENVGQLPIDLSFFMTNVTNEHVILQINDNQLRGFISETIGEPRMFGARIKWRFGS